MFGGTLRQAELELAGGTKHWWGCTGERNGNLVVEFRMDMGSGWVTYGYAVDGDGNVLEACVANYDPEGDPQERAHDQAGRPPDHCHPEYGGAVRKGQGCAVVRGPGSDAHLSEVA